MPWLFKYLTCWNQTSIKHSLQVVEKQVLAWPSTDGQFLVDLPNSYQFIEERALWIRSTIVSPVLMRFYADLGYSCTWNPTSKQSAVVLNLVTKDKILYHSRIALLPKLNYTLAQSNLNKEKLYHIFSVKYK